MATHLRLLYVYDRQFAELPGDGALVRRCDTCATPVHNLDAMTPDYFSEPLSSRFWRRYGADAFGLLEDIRADGAMAEVLIENAEYLCCEVAQAAHEVVRVASERESESATLHQAPFVDHP